MKILYLGDDSPHSTSEHRAAALRRLGHDVVQLNTQDAIPASRWTAILNIRTGFRCFERRVCRHLFAAIGHRLFDVVWIDCGQQLGPGFYKKIKAKGGTIINYNLDDPFGGRDHRKWDLYKQAVKYHDVTVVVRPENISEAGSWGARRVLRVFRSYDPVAHARREIPAAEANRRPADVVFVGSWMPERGPFMVRLLELGVPLSIFGDHWQKAKEWPRLRSILRGGAIYGDDHVKAIQTAKVALGLLSEGNRDRHTTRSAEIPFIGGAAFCAQRTEEHEAMYRDTVEAAFWKTPEECAELCRRLLGDEGIRRSMVGAARARVIDLGLSNDRVQSWIISQSGRNPGEMNYPAILCR
jgi:hypothetical protein